MLKIADNFYKGVMEFEQKPKEKKIKKCRAYAKLKEIKRIIRIASKMDSYSKGCWTSKKIIISVNGKRNMFFYYQ